MSPALEGDLFLGERDLGQTTSVVLVRKFQTERLKILLLRETETAFNLGIINKCYWGLA